MSSRLVIATLVAFCSFATMQTFAALPICNDPAAMPTRLIALVPAHQSFSAAFDNAHLFLTEFNIVHRYALNGGAPSVFDIGFVPDDFLISSAVPHNLFTNSLQGDRRVWVFDQNGTPAATLFSGPVNPNPGGIVGFSRCIALHPETGDLYVLCEGYYSGGSQPQWISRIQRFKANGTYDNLLINNQLGIPSDDPGFDVQNPNFPSCGAWHFPYQMTIDKNGNIFLWEGVNSARQLEVVHKFNQFGQCVGTWDVTGKRVGIDPDGYPYTSVGSTLTKLNKSWSQTLYTLNLLGAASGIRFMPHTSDFLLAGTNAGGSITRSEVFGPRIEPLDIIGESWQDTSFPYHLRIDNLELLTQCDQDKTIMEGVVADGVSPLFVRWKVPGPGRVEWELRDPTYPSARELLGTLSSLDETAVDTVSISVDVEQVADGAGTDHYYAFAVYSAPKNFDRKGMGSDNGETFRTVEFLTRFYPEASETPELVATQDIQLERPPVLFVHGLWGSAESWKSFPSIIGDSRWRTFQVDYKLAGGGGLAGHRETGTIPGAVSDTRRLLGNAAIVSAQIDVIAHSMGGLLARDFADGPGYKSAANYGAGDFHKLLFLDTPHEGSALADMMVRVREIIGNPLVPSLTLLGMARRASAFSTMGIISVAQRTPPEQILGKALDDLRPGSPAIAALQAVPVPTHSHVGDASEFFATLPAPYRGLFALTSAAAANVLGMTTFLKIPPSWEVLASPSDLIVTTASQQGGLTSQYYHTVFDFPHSIHTEVTKSPAAGSLAETWAHRRADDTSFFAPSIPAPAAVTPSPLATSSLQDSYNLMPDFVGGLSLAITDPPSGGITFPGKVIKVRVQGPLTPQDTVMVFYPGGALTGVHGDGNYGFSQPGGLPITIPVEYVGRFALLAVGENGDSRMLASQQVSIMVDPGAKSPPAVVTDLRVEPSEVVLSGPGAVEQMRVVAQYSDGIERDVTDDGLGTNYGGGGAAWQIGPNGAVIGKAPGSGSFIVTNSGHSVSVPITVESGPQINNAPHASAGGAYSACDGQRIFLDGTGSYDLDQKLGESLSYAWDLDADGQFDDATGPSPAVQLNFLGAFWLVGLKVTDPHGLDSTDYALLEAGPGCLDGQFVCAKTRNETGEAHVGMDAAGNVYVAEWSNTGAFGDRIVKFSSNCDSIATYSLPEPPGTVFVAPNGTIYVPDDFPSSVRKYTTPGVAPSVVTLNGGVSMSTIAVDGSGNIYATPNGSDTVNKYPPIGGAPTATWDVGQAVGETLFVWKIAVGPDGAIYAAFDNRVARGAPQGNGYVLDWVVGSSEPGVDPAYFNEIQGIAVGSSGDIYVSDHNNDRIQRFKNDGTVDRVWTGSGKPSNGSFDRSESIAVGPSERVAVVDRRLGQPLRLQLFGTTQAVPNAELEAFTRAQGDPSNLYPQATLPASGCPKGDADHIVIKVALDPATVTGPVPASALSIVLPPDDDAKSYAMVQADSDATLVDGKYRTTITLRKFGGFLEQEALVTLNGIGIGTVPIRLRSPDWVTGSPSYGIVNLSDLAKFGAVYTSPPKPYDAGADHRGPYGQVTLPDFAHYGSHNNHDVAGGARLVTALGAAQGTVRVEIIEENPVVGQRRLWARLILEGVETFKVMVIALRSEHPDLEYVSWHPGQGLEAMTPCTELVRDGVKQVFLGVIGNVASSGGSVELGKVEFAVTSEGELQLDDTDLGFLQAELLSLDENVRAFGGLRLERKVQGPTYAFELAQNYPNPFNPSTTISFSVARPSDVTLSIYDVRGALVKTLVRGRRDAGVHRLNWDGTDGRGSRVASGVYFYRLDAGSFRATRKMVLLR